MSRGVAVVIPARNEEDSIADAISSAWNAGATEVVVADGGSTDRTIDVATNAGATIVQGSSVRGGQSNLGAAATSTPILLFLHADSVLADGALKVVEEAVEAGAEFGGFRLRFHEPSVRLRLAATMINLRCSLTRCPWGDQAQWIVRQVFESTGRFREDPIMEDYELALRMKRRGQVRILDDHVTTSGRRFLRKGVLRTALVNWNVVLLWRLGVAPERLAAIYRG